MFGRLKWIFLMTALLLGAARGAVLDTFGRAVTQRQIDLTDWEGQIANPAVRYFVTAPTGLAFPVFADLSCPAARVYFDLPSTVGSNGPTKTIRIDNAAAQMPFRIAIFPDRDSADENYELSIAFRPATGASTNLTIPIVVHDEDRARENLFQVVLNFSKDVTGWTAGEDRRAIIRQAADDWAYFFDDMNFDAVAAGTENTWIWDTNGFFTGRYVSNAQGYEGFLLYAYGIAGPELRSGGEASYAGGVQRVNGAATKLKRSGGYQVETQGNYNTLGWSVSGVDEDWHLAGNLLGDTNDLASIAHHEIGHALGFNAAHPSFAEAQTDGHVASEELTAYLGRDAPIDASSHFNGIVDPTSGKGAFGYEYFGSMPRKRWLITKTDLLCMKALGYKLRETTAFAALRAEQPRAANALRGKVYEHSFKITGGVRPYFCRVESGGLPAGLEMNGFTGLVSGTPTETGRFASVLTITDSAIPPATNHVALDFLVADEIRFDLATARTLPTGELEVNITGAPSVPFVVQFSADLNHWTNILTNVVGGDFLMRRDDEGPARFYRAVVE